MHFLLLLGYFHYFRILDLLFDVCKGFFTFSLGGVAEHGCSDSLPIAGNHLPAEQLATIFVELNLYLVGIHVGFELVHALFAILLGSVTLPR